VTVFTLLAEEMALMGRIFLISYFSPNLLCKYVPPGIMFLVQIMVWKNVLCWFADGIITSWGSIN
jgi:hypothetical protein